MRYAHRLFWILALAVVSAASVGRAGELPPLDPLPADSRWVASLDVTAIRQLLRDLKLWEAVAQAPANTPAGQFSRLLTDTDRLTLCGLDTRRETMVLVVRLAPDAPPWTPLVAARPGYATHDMAGRTQHQWRMQGDRTLHAVQVDRAVYVSSNPARLESAMAATAATAEALQPAQRFAAWPTSLTGVLLVVAATDMQAFEARGHSPGVADLQALILTVSRRAGALTLSSRATAVDPEKAQQLLDVLQGSVSLGILSDRLPLPLRECLKSLRLNRHDAELQVDGTWNLEQIAEAWRALAAPPATAEVAP